MTEWLSFQGQLLRCLRVPWQRAWGLTRATLRDTQPLRQCLTARRMGDFLFEEVP